MSLESALDEERRAVMDILEGINRGRASHSRNTSPGGTQTPVKSMLDIGDKHTAKFLLPSDQEKEEKRKKREEELRAWGAARASSPQTSGARARSPLASDPEDSYQFNMLPSIDSRVPKRVTQGGKKDIKEGLPKSLLAAAEEDRKASGEYRVRSLLEPTVTVTGPNGEKMSQKKKGVHPTTNFDAGGSGMSTPMTSDTEQDISEIKRAQRMAMTMSPIHSTPAAHRCIRQIIRGDYAGMQREAERGLRRQRMYLVATDLSEEAAYALEWTIGTVLRDGDTLLAVYAVDEEVGTGGESGAVGIGEGAQMMRDTASLVKTLSSNQRIDFLDPTLVILGSRGRSALKGVLLGSFSNYLVTKSSVPVMVARKRLRKHSKYKRGNLRLSNVLSNPASRLASAKVD
ncbi:putative universal stress protein [Diplodia seriata]|uniref:Putative universal stress protein n=1 Tax=Diplodia seriata TaxID=420778 RepID=A0A0G2GR35_9PEZI|nr:putative universal stress protein [Diplodia seriata]